MTDQNPVGRGISKEEQQKRESWGEWGNKQYSQKKETWMPWIEDQYLKWFSKGDNKASYATKGKQSTAV
jgi:hypothetical protein